MERMPVIYVHLGTIPKYLIRAMNQASVYNSNVILLTDTGFKHKNVTSYEVKDLQGGIENFDVLYKHMSTNSLDFERKCIIRWFILNNFLKKEGIQACFYNDSDVMLYDNITTVYEHYKEFDASYTLAETQDNYRWAASACCSYWKAETLDKFANFVLDSYLPNRISTLLEKWNYHTSTNSAGGICDMTLLYLFSKTIKFYSLTQIKDGIAFDHNMRIAENYYPNEYEMEKPEGTGVARKKVVWKNNQPYGNNIMAKKEVRFIALTEYAKLLEEGTPVKKGSLEKIKSVVKKIVNG